jgi:hypothetical protein
MAASLGVCYQLRVQFFVGCLKIEPERGKLKNLHCWNPLPGNRNPFTNPYPVYNHTPKTHDNIFLIFTFSDRGREDKIFWTEW